MGVVIGETKDNYSEKREGGLGKRIFQGVLMRDEKTVTCLERKIRDEVILTKKEKNCGKLLPCSVGTRCTFPGFAWDRWLLNQSRRVLSRGVRV